MENKQLYNISCGALWGYLSHKIRKCGKGKGNPNVATELYLNGMFPGIL
jgi:hypothetical protein